MKSIALIHEKLYRSPGLRHVDFADYVRDLVSEMVRTYGVDQHRLNVTLRVDDIPLEIDTAIPCGLIINELVSNVLKHAFPPGGTGDVWIELTRDPPAGYLLMVRDTGVGLPPEIGSRAGGSLGLQLVRDLARQLSGAVEVENGAGTTFRVRFREAHYRERT